MLMDAIFYLFKSEYNYVLQMRYFLQTEKSTAIIGHHAMHT